MGGLLIKPVTFLDHLEGSVCLLRLVVVIELPRQIADEKQKKAKGSNDPNGALVFKQVACHVERSRDISNCQVQRFDSLTSDSLNLWSSRPCRGFPSRSILDCAALRSE